jgi:hypothetical protein
MYSSIPIHWNIKSAPASPGRSRVEPAFYVFSFLGGASVLPTPGKIIWPGYQRNSAAGRKNLPYPAAACMVIVDLFFFTTIQKIF